MLPPRFVMFAFDLHYRGLDPLQQSGFFTRTVLRTVSLRFSSAGGCRFLSPFAAVLALVESALLLIDAVATIILNRCA